MSDENGAPLRAIEVWARDKGTELHWFEAAKFSARWGAGREVSEEAFDAAIAHVKCIGLR
jgi:hypothetical protein